MNELTANNLHPSAVEVVVGKANRWVNVTLYLGQLRVEVYDREGDVVHAVKYEWPDEKKKFKVRASYQAMCETEIEANSMDEAYDIAKTLDGSSFDTQCDPDDWHIEDVWETER